MKYSSLKELVEHRFLKLKTQHKKEKTFKSAY